MGWGQENHAFLQVRASLYQPGGALDLRSWCDDQRAATSDENAVCLTRNGWNIDVREAASKLRCSVLVLHSERDAVIPRNQGRLLASLIPHSRFVQLESENHMPLGSEPAWQQLVREVETFLSDPAECAPAHPILPLNLLTPRERAVLEGIAGGLDNAEIAALLGLSEKNSPQPYYPRIRQNWCQSSLPSHCDRS